MHASSAEIFYYDAPLYSESDQLLGLMLTIVSMSGEWINLVSRHYAHW